MARLFCVLGYALGLGGRFSGSLMVFLDAHRRLLEDNKANFIVLYRCSKLLPPVPLPIIPDLPLRSGPRMEPLNKSGETSRKMAGFVIKCHLLSPFVVPEFCARGYIYLFRTICSRSYTVVTVWSAVKSLPIFTEFYRYRKTLPPWFVNSVNATDRFGLLEITRDGRK